MVETDEIEDITDIEPENGVTPPITEPLNAQGVKEPNKWYRYIDEACSGNAYVVNYLPERHAALTCANCGTALAEFKPENVIPLNEDEVKSIEAIQNASN